MATKTVYQYDLAGLYQNTTQADESPLEPGIYHIPARCTKVPPPEEIPDDKWPRWNGSEWELVNRPVPGEVENPVEKLQTFLDENPDVAALLNN